MPLALSVVQAGDLRLLACDALCDAIAPTEG